MFEARWVTIQDRMPDIFQAGYGAMWLPSPSRADSGNGSVGYDIYDRFDLGVPRNQTLYGTEATLRHLVTKAHQASVNIYTDMILNHAGFSDLNTVDDNNTQDPSDDVTFADAGGYPGLAITLPGVDIHGDFHGEFEPGDHQARLAGLVDIAQEKHHWFIRHPVGPDPNNIPAGTTTAFGRIANVPDPANSRFYPDTADGGTQLDLGGGNFATRYNFNRANPLAGDPGLETAEHMLMRHVQWMVQEIGVDGFRLDAVKHFSATVLQTLDQAVFRASPQLNHDGSIKPVYSFSEVLDGNKGFIQGLIDRSLSNNNAIDPSNFVVQGNRDALDFPLFFAMRNNLTDHGGNNNWHEIRNASQDTQDDGMMNGSQGVSFIDSHDNLDGGFPFLKNVGYAYNLMRPGQANVYFNATEFGERTNNFPNQGKEDALGGISGNTITTLVNLRNTHGRGNFHERWIDDAFNANGFSNVYVYERENSAIVALSSSTGGGFEERSPIQTGFAPNAVLVELTGNGADPQVDPDDNIPEVIRVNENRQVVLRIPGNAGHGRGYLVYGLPGPRGTLSLANVAFTLAGKSPTSQNNGTARLSDIEVITGDSFSVQLDTSPVILPPPLGESHSYRDFDADGDNALIRMDDRINLNATAGLDHVLPGSVLAGFEEFTHTRIPGYLEDANGDNIGTGTGQYIQNIDTTRLSEGRHYLTVRAFRHREDGGEPIFTDFRRTVIVDRLPPESEFISFEPFSNLPDNPENRDVLIRSVDGTANKVSIFRDLGANFSEQSLLTFAQAGFDAAEQFDSAQWLRGFENLASGNHAFTVVMVEETGGTTLRRYTGHRVEGGLGAGFGDIDADGTLEASDIEGSFSVESILNTQNSQFSPAFDLNGDGLGDNRDLFALEQELINGGASGTVLTAYHRVLVRRGDLDQQEGTGVADLDMLYDNFGSTEWLLDLDVDGTLSLEDVVTFVTDIFRTVPGDFDLNGLVNSDDLEIWQTHNGTALEARYYEGDADFDGDVDLDDRAIWESAQGSVAPAAILRADFNGNGIVDAADYSLWVDSRASTTNLVADADGDGVIGIGDYAFWKLLFGKSLLKPPVATAAQNGAGIPEPGSHWLFAIFVGGYFLLFGTRLHVVKSNLRRASQ